MIGAKLLKILSNDPKTSAEKIVKLSFSDTKQKQVERKTK